MIPSFSMPSEPPAACSAGDFCRLAKYFYGTCLLANGIIIPSSRHDYSSSYRRSTAAAEGRRSLIDYTSTNHVGPTCHCFLLMIDSIQGGVYLQVQDEIRPYQFHPNHYLFPLSVP